MAGQSCVRPQRPYRRPSRQKTVQIPMQSPWITYHRHVPSTVGKSLTALLGVHQLYCCKSVLRTCACCNSCCCELACQPDQPDMTFMQELNETAAKILTDAPTSLDATALTFKPRSSGQKALTSIKLIFALPWRRFKKNSVLYLKVLCCLRHCIAVYFSWQCGPLLSSPEIVMHKQQLWAHS